MAGTKDDGRLPDAELLAWNLGQSPLVVGMSADAEVGIKLETENRGLMDKVIKSKVIIHITCLWWRPETGSSYSP